VRPRTIEDEQVAELNRNTLQQKPKDGPTHGSVRLRAKESGIFKPKVYRYLQLFSITPRRRESYKLSSDGFFIEKLPDVAGLYLNPPETALVLSVD
jgi:putative transposase